jgi:hypothetical protein
MIIIGGSIGITTTIIAALIIGSTCWLMGHLFKSDDHKKAMDEIATDIFG